MKILLFILSEYFAGLVAFSIVLTVMGVIPGSAYNFKAGVSFMVLEYKEMIIIPAVIGAFKVITGYYLYLFLLLKLRKKKYSALLVKDFINIFVVAIFSILLLILILPLGEGRSFDGWQRMISKLFQWFFYHNKQWSLLVYSGLLATLLSPLIYSKLIKKFVEKA